MKKLWFLLLCCMLFMICGILSVSAQELSEDVIRVVTENLDNFFILSAVNDSFETKIQPIRGNIGPETATEVSTNGTRNILLYVNPDGTTEYSFFEKLNTGNLKNFYFEMDVIPNDLYPAENSGCYIGYIANSASVLSVEEPLTTVSLLVSDAIYLETAEEGESVSSIRTKLTDFSEDSVKLLIVRLTGETLFYADGEFIGAYQDGKDGPFQLRYGVESFLNGETVDCSFDNMVVRKVVP